MDDTDGSTGDAEPSGDHVPEVGRVAGVEPVPGGLVAMVDETTATLPVPPGSDGSRRRRTALAVVGTAVVAGLVGGVIGNRIQSPADRAAESDGPVPSLITVPVERRALSSEIVLSGSRRCGAEISVRVG
jgi:hypothetical protein